jgi:hypothetical protein
LPFSPIHVLRDPWIYFSTVWSPWSCSMSNNDDSPRYQFFPSTCLFFPPSSKYSPQHCTINNLNPSFSVRNKMSGLHIKQNIIIPFLILSASLYGKEGDGYLKWIQVYVCSAIMQSLPYFSFTPVHFSSVNPNGYFMYHQV